MVTLKWAKEHDKKSIITGDGADELFAGYNFLVNKPENELEAEIKRVCSVMHFPTQEIGKSLGVKVESPFLNEKVIEIANQIPSNLKVKEEENVRYGKWILRKTFETYIPTQIAWRKKSPMQEGAGTAGLTNLFESIINEEKYVGDIISSDGKLTKTIQQRTSRAVGIISQITTILKTVSLGNHYFFIAILLRNAMFISSVLINSEVWYPITKTDIEELETMDRQLIRKVLEVPESCPNELLCLETGCIPLLAFSTTYLQEKKMNCYQNFSKLGLN